jgi:hypothetical protein
MRIAFAFVAIAVSLFATPASAIDFTAPLINPDGVPYKKCVKPDPDDARQCAKDGYVDQTLGRFVADALNIVDPSVTNEGIVSRGLLALKVRDAANLDLSDKERDVIKAAVLASYAKAGTQPTVIVTVLKIIDPASTREK